ncbi:MAG TPA: NADH-quinone oxidoreductase subunit L [Aquabacterium sp.]|uniref:NADH-quinone oxidoreductase subunit L n=1 Tax=Aquabacterium sp. TaxID=1872578 RepID=UPI002E319EF1|nr:NADH-quinone oxidoreductase subunit L [Aquabacterium sp.]HEX5356789.1 NADH-quinone oxidoreductase subunit L [Aquabacterium sp.]
MAYARVLESVTLLAPALLMAVSALLSWLGKGSMAGPWRGFMALSFAALAMAAWALVQGGGGQSWHPALHASTLGLWMALLVQVLGTVIGSFSARYLEGEAGQGRYAAALALVLSAVHLLLMADHWALLIGSWALVGMALQHLLCFYPDRAFARLAAHKKRIADRLADVLLIGAAALAWREVGSGSLSDLWAHIGREGVSPSLQACAVGLVLAVMLRTALLPVHGWLIQVMEAPTPVSALLHAGVVNLGGFVLIRFAPLLEQAMPARALLLLFGLSTAVLAGMVMLTRISIKVRLAWSTVAQMGFMLLECGLGLHAMAALHLFGHSIYKAHAFLSASSVVRETRLQAMRGTSTPVPASLVAAPLLTISVILLMQELSGLSSWPWWWSVMLGLAWAPVLWLPTAFADLVEGVRHLCAGLLMVSGLSGVTLLAHALPLGIHDVPHHVLGLIALLGMLALYLCLACLQYKPAVLKNWRRWSYAGFYVDEAYTRLALQLWPGDWSQPSRQQHRQYAKASPLADASP